MKNNKKLLSKLLTIILSTMMVFSSVLVVNTNVVLAETSDEQTEEVAPQTEEKVEPSEEEKTVIEEIVDNVSDNTIINEGSDDTTSGDEAKEEPTVVNEVIEEKVKEDIEETNNKPKTSLKSTAPMKAGALGINLGFKIYSAVFYTIDSNGRKTKYNTQSKLGKSDVITKPADPAPVHEGETFAGWYERLYVLGQLVAEREWNFATPDHVIDSCIFTELLDIPTTFTIELYPKFISEANSNYETYFDFKVKHKNSYGIDINNNGTIDLNNVDEAAAFDEFKKNNTTGDFLKVGEDGYLYSYYSYYKTEDGWKIVDLFKEVKHINDPYYFVKDYQYVLSSDQVEIKTGLTETEKNNLLEEFADEDNTGYICQKYDTDSDGDIDHLDVDYTGSKYTVTKEGDDNYTVQIGEYYVGTAFDLAIQEANEDDTIVLLPHNFDNGQLYNNDFYIVKPIEIWGDVNLDLNGCTVTFNENSISLDILHFFDRARRNRELIFPKEICAAIYVSNAKTTISNGTINSLHTSGKGILVTSDQPSWVTTIEDIEIHVKEGNNAIESGCYSFDNSGNVSGVNRGYVNVKSGLIDGYILNNDKGDLKINGETTYKVVNNEITDQYVYTGVKFKKDPRVKANGESTNILLGSGYQIWDDGQDDYKYYVDATAEAELLVNDTTTQYKHLETAIYEFEHGNYTSGTITLLKDREQNGRILPIDIGNKSLTLNFDSNKINEGDLEIRSGNVTLAGNGYVNNVRYVGGNLFILDGHYDDLTYTTADVQNIYVSGGFYKKKLSASILKDTNPNDQFTCVYSDMPGYQYQVLPIGEIQQVKLYLNNSLVDNTKYPGLISAINAINEGVIKADAVELLRNITVNDVITINKPITLDLGTFTINSNVVLGGEEEFPEVPLFDDEDEDPVIIFDVDPTYEPLGDVYSVYVDIKDSNKNVIIKNGTIINKSEIEDGNSSTTYGIYNVNGNITTNGFNLVIDARNFDRMTAIYNGTSGSIKLKDYSRIRSLQNAKSGWEATTAENVDFVINDGTLNICDKSQIYISCGDRTQSLTGIVNNGTLVMDNPGNIENVVNITVISTNGVLTDTYGIKNYGNIHMNGGQISISNNQGNCYGIFAANNSINEAKNIILEKEANISIEKKDTSNKSTYGIYVASPSIIGSQKSEPMNITLGKCKIVVGSRDKAYGICSYGGRIVSATIGGNVAPSNTVLMSSSSKTPDKATENNAAEIIINAGSGSVGIDNEYVDETKAVSPSQLANTYISMEKSMSHVYGDDTYCVKSGTSSIGIYIYDGYYSNVGNGKLLSTNVNACGGYYSKRVTPAKNYICVELEEKKNHINAEHSVNNDYFYTILSDGSSMSATVPDSKGSFEVIIKVKYDTYMLDNPDKYGVIIRSEAFGNDYIRFTIAQSMEQISEDIDVTSDYPFEYKFSMPAKNISEKFSISIVDFMQEEPHVYRSVSNYSIEKYCYTVLKTKNTKGLFAYSLLQRSLCATMLNYGTYAQLYFNPGIIESNLANRDLDTYPIDNGSTTMFSKLVTYNEELDERDDPDDYSSMFKTLAHSISLNTDSYGLQFAFELADALKDPDIKFYCDGKEIEPVSDGNLWYIDVENIATRELNRDYGIEIVAGGNTYNMVYSLIDYIYDANNSTAGESLLKNLLNSLYEYYIVVQNFMR